MWDNAALNLLRTALIFCVLDVLSKTPSRIPLIPHVPAKDDYVIAVWKSHLVIVKFLLP